MIHFIITSVLLSLAGWLIYVCWVRVRTSFKQQKQFIYFTFAASLLLPILISPGQGELFNNQVHVEPLAPTAPIHFGHLKQYCKCVNPNYSHRITYRANGYYNFLLEHKMWITGAIMLAMGFVLVKLILQIVYLHKLVERADQTLMEVNGKRFILLELPKAHGAGAFWLGEKYIIWQEEMISLTDRERKAIFLHEISHLEQGNTLEKAALNVIQCVWFLNPVFYYFRRELDLISECIADQSGAVAFPERKAYARLLIKLKEMQTTPLIQYFKGNSLRLRITRLLEEPAGLQSTYPFAVALALLITLQIGIVSPVSAQVDRTIREFQTYEEIYHKVDPNKEEAIYCQDCETVCTPEE